MRDSILYSAIRALVVAFCVVIGLGLGFVFISVFISTLSSSGTEGNLTTFNTEEILPNAEGERKALTSQSPVILQIDINGEIGMGVGGVDEKSIRQQLMESREGSFKGNRVKALLLYIDTPGGTVNDSDGIFRALQEYKKKYQVPIYAYVDGLCASGGMYIALAADKIFANDISLIGSVGVLSPPFMNFSKLLDKIGIDTLTISAGKDKDALNPFRPWKPSEEENHRQIVDYYYNHFVEIVTTHRPNISKDKLVKDYGAHVFPAPQAKEYGFIDFNSVTLAETLKELLKEIGITTNDYQVIRLENKGWWKTLLSSQASSLFTGKIQHQISFTPEGDLLLGNEFLYLYRPQ